MTQKWSPYASKRREGNTLEIVSSNHQVRIATEAREDTSPKAITKKALSIDNSRSGAPMQWSRGRKVFKAQARRWMAPQSYYPRLVEGKTALGNPSSELRASTGRKLQVTTRGNRQRRRSSLFIRKSCSTTSRWWTKILGRGIASISSPLTATGHFFKKSGRKLRTVLLEEANSTSSRKDQPWTTLPCSWIETRARTSTMEWLKVEHSISENLEQKPTAFKTKSYSPVSISTNLALTGLNLKFLWGTTPQISDTPAWRTKIVLVLD